VSTDDFLTAAFRHWRSAALAGFVVLLLTSAAVLTQPRLYTAQATLIVGNVMTEVPAYEDVLLAQRLAPTYALLATTRPVAAAVAESLGGGSDPDELLRAVSARASLDSLLIRISARDGEPSTAAAIANAFAAELVRRTTPADDAASAPAVSVIEEAAVPAAPDAGNVVFLILGATAAVGVAFAVILISTLRDRYGLGEPAPSRAGA
jgi:capsular polysaccharide biosynthesis protein